MVNKIDIPELIYPVVILEIEPKMINIDGSDTILDKKEEKYQWEN